MCEIVASIPLAVNENLNIQKRHIQNGKSKTRLSLVTGTHGDELEGQYLAYMGENEIHARFIASQGNQRVGCVLFRKAQEYKEQLDGSRPVSLIGTASAQVWNGRTRVQLIVEEII